MTYGRAVKILRNGKKHTTAEIKKATQVYNNVNRISRCPICNAYQYSYSTTPCFQCLTTYSTKLNKYYP